MKENRLFNIYGEKFGTNFAGNVWDKEAISPAILTMAVGNRQPMVLDEPIICASRGREEGGKNVQKLELGGNVCNALTSVDKDNMVLEPSVLKYERTEEGKQLRKQYESGEICHGFREHSELTPRGDGVSNTLSTVEKDNMLIEPKVINVGNYGNGHRAKDVSDVNGIMPTIVTGNHGTGQAIAIQESTKKGYSLAYEGDSVNLGYPNSKTRRGRVGNQLSQTLDTNCEIGIVESHIGSYNYKPGFRIRKLTEGECFKLMGVKAEDFKRIREFASKSLCYHMAGDSIVTTCLMAIFGEMLGIDYESKIKELQEELKTK